MFVKDVLHYGERKKDVFRGVPVERSHREGIVLPLPDSKQLFEVSERIEGVASVEFFVILRVTAFHLPVMAWGICANLLVPDTELREGFLKERQGFVLAVAHFIGEFKSVICLDAFNCVGEFLHHMFKKLGGRIGALLFECF